MEFFIVVISAVIVFLAWHLAEFMGRMAKCAEDRNAIYDRDVTLQEAYASRDFADTDDDDDYFGFGDDEDDDDPPSSPSERGKYSMN